MRFAPQRRALFRHPDVKKWSEPLVFWRFSLGNALRTTTACTFSTSQLPKGLYFVHFDLEMCFAPQWRALCRTSKSGPRLECFVHCDLEVCFAPQPRALFRHLNFQKCSERDVFCTFWLRNVLRTTTACTFSSLIWPAGSAPAALPRLLFDPPEPQIIGETRWIATLLPFREPASSFSWLSPSLIFSLLDFSSLTLPTSAFPSLHIVGSLTSKLPSMMGEQFTILTMKYYINSHGSNWYMDGTNWFIPLLLRLLLLLSSFPLSLSSSLPLSWLSLLSLLSLLWSQSLSLQLPLSSRSSSLL